MRGPAARFAAVPGPVEGEKTREASTGARLRLDTMSDMTITAAVDGSSLSNPGPSGWAWVVDDDHWDAGGWPEGTNNLGELTAILELLKATEAAGLAPERLQILADSQYAINVITKWRHSWKKRAWTKADKQRIKNLEVIQEIDRIIEGRDVSFEWVKGHAGHAMNEKADDLARGCAEAYKEGRTPAPGPRFGAPGAPSPTAHPTAPPLPGAAPSPADDIRELEKRFIQAWMSRDAGTLAELRAPGCVRVWPDGRTVAGLEGPVPPGPKVGRFEVRDAGGAILVTYTLSWQGGQAAELSVWAPDPGRGPLLVHHQSTPIADRG